MKPAFNDLQNILEIIGKKGHRHHVAVTPGKVADVLKEAFFIYLGYDIELV